MSDKEDMTGVLFRSTSENPKAPVLSGYITVNGDTIRVSGWYATDRETGAKRLDKNGNPFLRLKLQTEQDMKPKPQPKLPVDEDIPF